MWPWQKRSPFTSLDLPHKCFISHSYKDAKAREKLLALLPGGVEPFIFPPVVVPPEEMVSNDLIAAILACDGEIYLEGGASKSSFWVAFERDYALRAGKPVFGYEPKTNRLHPDISAPLRLPVFLSHSHRDNEQVKRIQKIMADERYFDTWIDTAEVWPGSTKFTIMSDDGLLDRLHDGGYVVLCWSQEAAESLWVDADMQRVLREYRQQIIVALLDETPLSANLDGVETIQLYSDAERSQPHRIDDLIVRLYWLIYRNTRQNKLDH